MTEMQFLSNEFGDAYLYEVNRNAFNQIGSDAVIRRQFGEILERADSLNIIIGSDSGLLIRYIHKHSPAEGSRFIFVEPRRLIPAIEQQLADLELDDRFFLAAPDEWMALSQRLRFSQYAFIDNVRVFRSIGASDGFCPDYARIHSDVQAEVRSFLWRTRFSLGGQIFTQRELENLLESEIPASCLRGRFKGHTAVLLGGGPSLDTAIPWIQANRGRLTVIAVSRICRRLLQTPLVPDIIVSIDPTALSYDISKEMLRFGEGPLFVHANHVSFPLLAQWSGPSAYLGPLLPWDSKHNEPNITTASPTVTNTAVNLAMELGFSRLLLAGVDLCHSREGYSHARGSNEYDTGPRMDSPGFTVETNGGWKADTTPDFYNAIGSMEAQAGLAGKAGCEVISLAPGAARIPGIGFRLPEAIRLEPLPVPPARILRESIGGAAGSARSAHVETLRQEILTAVRRLGEIKKLARQALRFNEGLFGRRGRPADFKYKKRMDRIEHQLDTAYKDLSRLVRSFSAREFLRMPPSDREWSDDEIEQAGKTYYEAYANSAQRLIDLFQATRVRLDVALEEERETPDFSRLLEQWEKDGIPGRARVWRLRHAEVYARLDDAVKAELERLERQFTESLDERDTGHARQCREFSSLRPVRGDLLTLFDNGKQDGLHQLEQKLEHTDGREAEELMALARGYLAELGDDPARAFEHYATLVENAQTEVERHTEDSRIYFNPRLEDALRRMLVIAMAGRERDNALLLMDALATMSPPYAPQYAEMLRLTGNLEKAIDVYTDYLTKAPHDLAAMMKLGKLYQGIGATDAALEAFRYVTGNDPHNRAARTLLNDLERTP